MMNKTSIAFLIGFINNQNKTVENIFARLKLISPIDEANTDSLAYQIHNYYSAVEDIFSEIQKIFGSELPLSSSNYHKELLKYMVIEMPTIRPKVITQANYEFLEHILKFRHLFRHAYNYQLDPKKVYELKQLILKEHPQLSDSIVEFLSIIESNLS